MTLTTNSLRSFLFAMFEENERMAERYATLSPSQLQEMKDAKPFLDEELENIVRTRFASSPSTLDSLNTVTTFIKSRIRIWRSEYNRGLWTQKPTYRSFRYGSQGLPVNRHLHILSAGQYACQLADFPFPDPRKPEALTFLSKEGTLNALSTQES